MHFAASAYVGESVHDPRKYFHNNVQNGLALVNAAIDAGVRISSFRPRARCTAVPEHVPITEDTRCQPVNPYGESKLFFERILDSYSRAYGLRAVALRYFNAAGADESGEIGELHLPETHLIPLALEAAAGLRPHLEVFGNDHPTSDGTCIRDYIHVTDLAEAHALAVEFLQRQTGGAFTALNLGTGEGSRSSRLRHGRAGHVTSASSPHRRPPGGRPSEPGRRSRASSTTPPLDGEALPGRDGCLSLEVAEQRQAAGGPREGHGSPT